MGRKEEMVRAFYTEHHAGEVPIDSTVQELYAQFQRLNEDVDVSYGLFNGVTKKIRNGFTPGAATSSRSRMVPGQGPEDLLDQVGGVFGLLCNNPQAFVEARGQVRSFQSHLGVKHNDGHNVVEVVSETGSKLPYGCQSLLLLESFLNFPFFRNVFGK